MPAYSGMLSRGDFSVVQFMRAADKNAFLVFFLQVCMAIFIAYFALGEVLEVFCFREHSEDISGFGHMSGTYRGAFGDMSGTYRGLVGDISGTCLEKYRCVPSINLPKEI